MLTEMINSWLGDLSKADRELFLRRYYLCESVRDIAERYGLNQNAMAQRLSKLRNRLKDYLDKRGYSL
jgi:RNA polymerase sigma-70 factor (ECF subfamily)